MLCKYRVRSFSIATTYVIIAHIFFAKLVLVFLYLSYYEPKLPVILTTYSIA
jgi:hypothetical protein